MRYPVLFTTAATATGILVLDQLSKAWVLSRAVELSEARPTVGLTLVMNRSIAFSLPVSGLWVFVLTALVVAIVAPTLARSMDWSKRWSGAVAGVLLGGAVGNIIDRLRFGAVVDFVKVGWWPVFNVADAAISCSVVFLLLFGKHAFNATKPGDEPGAAPRTNAG